MAGWSWAKSLAVAVLLILAGVDGAVLAQSPLGSLTGKLTDLYSKPLCGASVTARNLATSEEKSAVTAEN
jgi:hypothetical protein